MAAKIKVDQIETVDGSGTIALQNQLSGMTGASMPTGSVLQVVNAQYDTATSVTSTSNVSLGLTASITPSSTSSKVLVSMTVMIRCNGDTACDVLLYKNSGSIFQAGNDLGDNGTSAHENLGSFTFMYLDSPSTTSSTTYTAYGRSIDGDTIVFHENSCRSTVTLMEIAG